MEGIIRFMNSAAGRILRIVIGAILFYFGFWKWAPEWWGYVLGVIGAFAFIAGLFGFCVLQIFVKPKSTSA